MYCSARALRCTEFFFFCPVLGKKNFFDLGKIFFFLTGERKTDREGERKGEKDREIMRARARVCDVSLTFKF